MNIGENDIFGVCVVCVCYLFCVFQDNRSEIFRKECLQFFMYKVSNSFNVAL